MLAELCDGCEKQSDTFEEVGFLGHHYCAECVSRARAYMESVKALRIELSEIYELRLMAIRNALIPTLIKRPDQP